MKNIIRPPPAWQTITTNVADANGYWQFTDANGYWQFTDTNGAAFQRRFYRAALP